MMLKPKSCLVGCLQRRDKTHMQIHRKWRAEQGREINTQLTLVYICYDYKYYWQTTQTQVNYIKQIWSTAVLPLTLKIMGSWPLACWDCGSSCQGCWRSDWTWAGCYGPFASSPTWAGVARWDSPWVGAAGSPALWHWWPAGGDTDL